MRILYGIVGVGMGHATRSAVLLDHLLNAGHEVRVVSSGGAHDFLTRRFVDRPGITLDEIHGLQMALGDNALDKSETAKLNLTSLPKGLLHNIEVYREVAEQRFRPQLVISDFESWAYLYGLNHRLPVISIDNMQILNRCEHDDDVTEHRNLDFGLAKAFVKMKLPGARHYLITSFFFPPIRKARTTLIPPILREQILSALREPGEHVLYYQTGGAKQDPAGLLAAFPEQEFRVYGAGRQGHAGHISFRPFSETGFVDDLRTAKAVVASAGFSLMGEAVHLRVPMLAIPIRGQYEQRLNAKYLSKLGYGAWGEELSAELLERFLAGCDGYQEALQDYQPQDNSELFRCVDKLIDEAH